MNGEDTRLLREVLVEELRDIRTDTRLTRAAVQEQGTQIALIKDHLLTVDGRCTARGEKCSAEFRKLGSCIKTVEDTGVHHIIDDTRWKSKMMWSVLRISIAAILALAGLGLSAYSAFRCGRNASKATTMAAVRTHGSVTVVRDATTAARDAAATMTKAK